MFHQEEQSTVFNRNTNLHTFEMSSLLLWAKKAVIFHLNQNSRWANQHTNLQWLTATSFWYQLQGCQCYMQNQRNYASLDRGGIRSGFSVRGSRMTEWDDGQYVKSGLGLAVRVKRSRTGTDAELETGIRKWCRITSGYLFVKSESEFWFVSYLVWTHDAHN